MTIKKILDVTDNLALFCNPLNRNHSIWALKRLRVNSVLHNFSARENVPNPTYLSVQVAENKHIHLSPTFYNTSIIVANEYFFRYEVIALRNIFENEEVTFFYPSTEWSMTQPFEVSVKPVAVWAGFRAHLIWTTKQ